MAPPQVANWRLWKQLPMEYYSRVLQKQTKQTNEVKSEVKAYLDEWARLTKATAQAEEAKRRATGKEEEEEEKKGDLWQMNAVMHARASVCAFVR